jgi:hypothetical protein
MDIANLLNSAVEQTISVSQQSGLNRNEASSAVCAELRLIHYFCN